MIRRLKSFFRSIKYGIENLIYYLPVIWHDRNWDWMYFIELMQRKLKRWEVYERKYGFHVNSLKDAHRIRICRILCERILANDYATMYDSRWEPLFKNFYAAMMNSIERKDPYFEIEVEKTELEHKISKWKYEAESKMLQQDLDLLFKMLNKHLLSWWN